MKNKIIAVIGVGAEKKIAIHNAIHLGIHSEILMSGCEKILENEKNNAQFNPEPIIFNNYHKIPPIPEIKIKDFQPNKFFHKPTRNYKK